MVRFAVCILSIFTVLFSFSCGGGGGGETASPVEESGIDTLQITVSDTLGVMMGDSSYVFGNITEVEVSESGEIYVLDGLRCRLSIFDERGSFLRSTGRTGSGPGEYRYPRSMALYSDGHLVISDWPAATITYLNSDLSCDTVLSSFGQLSPHSIEPLPDGDYIGGDLEYRSAGEMPEGDLIVARYGRSDEPEKILWSWPLMITVQEEENGERGVYISNADAVWDTSPDGNMYISVRSDSTWWYMSMSPDGDTLFHSSREWERIPKTEEELASGEYTESLSFSDDGPSSISRGRDLNNVNPWKTAIASIDSDAQGRIWLGQGWTDHPLFQVYSPEGRLLFVAEIPDLAGTEGIQYSMGGGGLVGYDTEPLDYPKVYLLQCDSL